MAEGNKLPRAFRAPGSGLDLQRDEVVEVFEVARGDSDGGDHGHVFEFDGGKAVGATFEDRVAWKDMREIFMGCMKSRALGGPRKAELNAMELQHHIRQASMH